MYLIDERINYEYFVERNQKQQEREREREKERVSRSWTTISHTKSMS